MNLNLKIKKISLHGADYLKATMKGESCSEQLVSSSEARVHWEQTGHRLNQILSMKVTGISLHVAATTAAKQRNLGYKRARRCRSHMLHLTAPRIHTCFTWDYQWGGIKGKAANPESLILIGLCKAFMSALLFRYSCEWSLWNWFYAVYKMHYYYIGYMWLLRCLGWCLCTKLIQKKRYFYL